MKKIKWHNFIFLLLLIITNIISDQSTKIISYNIRYDNNWDSENSWVDRKGKIISLIKNNNPSIIGIQEGLANQVKYIDSSLTNYKYIGIGRDGEEKGEYSAIFYDTTKFKVMKFGTFWLSKTPDTISIGWDAVLNRICTYGLFKKIITKEKIWIFNTHFDHKGVKARENSAQLILTKISEINARNYPVILMGDINVTPKEKPIHILKTLLEDTLEISKNPLVGPTGTFNGFKNNLVIKKIDYFFTKGLSILSYTHIDDLLNNNKHISDHLPIMIEIENY